MVQGPGRESVIGVADDVGRHWRASRQWHAIRQWHAPGPRHGSALAFLAASGTWRVSPVLTPAVPAWPELSSMAYLAGPPLGVPGNSTYGFIWWMEITLPPWSRKRMSRGMRVLRIQKLTSLASAKTKIMPRSS